MQWYDYILRGYRIRIVKVQALVPVSGSKVQVFIGGNWIDGILKDVAGELMSVQLPDKGTYTFPAKDVKRIGE
jgi:hypothetical protein